MTLLNRFYRIAISLLFAVSAVHADTASDMLQELVLTGDLYGRSSLDFRKESTNVEFTIPEGSEGKILETRKLSRTGSYGVKVQLTKVNGKRGRNTPKPGDETWVYFSQKDPWLTFKDKEGSDVDDPEIALISRAKRDGEGTPIEGVVKKIKLPTKTEVLREQKPIPAKGEDPNLAKPSDQKQTEAGICTTCHAAPPVANPKTVAEIEQIQRELTEAPDNKSLPDKNWSQFPEVAKYATSAAVEKSIRYGVRNKESRSKKQCYRYVKRAILGGDLVDDYLPGAKATYGISDLKRRGFINMMDDPRYKKLISRPEDAPKGAVLIYRNPKSTKHPGHIEIKTDWGSAGGYVSDFYRSTSTRLHNRELIGVMIKEK